MNAPNLGTENPMTDKEILDRVVEELTVEGRAKRNSLNAEQRDAADDEARSFYRKVINRYRAAIASMPHSEQVEGWQPIETAPRDGSKFLVTDGNDYDFGSWHRDHVCGELEGHTPFTLWAPLPTLTRNVSDKE